MSKTISLDELRERLDRHENLHLVNVLEPEFFEQQHIPGSINVPVTEIQERAEEMWGHDDAIIVYCTSHACKASVRAAAKLERLGFTNVMEFEGGLAEWVDAGYPISSAAEAA